MFDGIITAIRRWLGLDHHPLLADVIDVEKQRDTPAERENKPYLGYPVPLEASFDPDDSNVFVAHFADNNEETRAGFPVVPANDGTSVLVFSNYFLSENPEDKSVVYDDYEMRMRREPHDHPKRLEDVNRMYEHLFRDREPHRRVVRYLGRTTSGYRLERLWPGSVEACNDIDNDAVLALHQRWAMQILSALSWLHARGVTLQRGALQQNSFWLRSDLSIAVAGLPTAGCLELEIPAEFWESFHFVNPWGPQMSGRCAPPYSWRDTGTPKGDLVDWATWVYWLMIGDEADPLRQYGMHGLEFEEIRVRSKDRRDAAEKGTFTDWPRLEKKRLGEVLVKAWSGEYDTADEVLKEVRETLVKCGRSLTEGTMDEIDGLDWTALFELGPLKKLKLRR